MADYIDGFLGCLHLRSAPDLGRRPDLGAQRRRGRLRHLPPAVPAGRAGLAHAHRGLPGASPSASSTARSSGSRSATARAWPRWAPTSPRWTASEQRRRLRGRRGVLRPAVGALLRGHVRRARVRGQPGRRRLGVHRLRGRRAAPGLQRRRGVATVTVDAIIVGSGPGGATAAEVLTRAGWSVVIMEKGRNHLLDPDDLTRPAGDYSNDEIKFIYRYFLGPDPLVEPRTFRRSADDGEHTHVGEVNSIPTTVGGGGTHADGKVPRFREEDFRLCSTYGPQDGADGGRLAARLRRARAVLRRGGAGHRRGRAARAPTPSPPGGRAPIPMPPGRAHVRRRALVGRRRDGRPATPTRRPRRPTASPTTAARPATTAASAPSSAAPSTPRATRSPCCTKAMATGRAELLAETFVQPDRHRGPPGHRRRLHRPRRGRRAPWTPTW